MAPARDGASDRRLVPLRGGGRVVPLSAHDGGVTVARQCCTVTVPEVADLNSARSVAADQRCLPVEPWYHS
jgi:hypothetical protein